MVNYMKTLIWKHYTLGYKLVLQMVNYMKNLDLKALHLNRTGNQRIMEAWFLVEGRSNAVLEE